MLWQCARFCRDNKYPFAGYSDNFKELRKQSMILLKSKNKTGRDNASLDALSLPVLKNCTALHKF